MSNYSATDKQANSDPRGQGIPADGALEFGGTYEGEFYDQRDDLVGGTDTCWTPDWSSRGDNAPTTDAAKWSTGGTLSQQDLAGSGS